MKTYFTFILIMIFGLCSAQNPQYPEPKEGFKKIELSLPKKSNEKDYKVEFFVTLVRKVAKCSSPSSTVKLERRYLLPNRYVYYEVKNQNIQIVTLMNAECGDKIDKKVYNYPLTEEYQSRSPYIFYIPKDMNIEYRIWKVDTKYIEIK